MEIVDNFNCIDALIQKKIEEAIKNRPGEKFISECIDKIAEALSNAQGSYTSMYYNRTNPITRDPYVDIELIFKSTRPSLKENGLAITQSLISTDEGIVFLYSILVHSSGQYISSKSRIFHKSGEMKVFSSVLNEVKKQHLQALLGLAPTRQDDDDCEEETKLNRIEKEGGTSIIHNHGPYLEDNYERISNDELKELDYHLTDDLKDVYRDILKTYKIEYLSDLPKEKYRYVLDNILKIRNKRKFGKK